MAGKKKEEAAKVTAPDSSDAEKLMAIGIDPALAQQANLSFSETVALLRQLLTMATQYPTLIGLVSELFGALTSKNWAKAIDVGLKIVALFVQSEPTPAPDPFQ